MRVVGVDYGDMTIKLLAESLKTELGQCFGHRNLMRMVRFYDQLFRTINFDDIVGKIELITFCRAD